jgi:hypothetical protein
MSIDTRKRRFGTLTAAAVGAVALGMLALPLTPAKAQVPYLGIDLGGGFGIGIGAPPSAYGLAPASPLYPLYGAPAAYHYYPYAYPYRPYYR